MCVVVHARGLGDGEKYPLGRPTCGQLPASEREVSVSLPRLEQGGGAFRNRGGEVMLGQ